MSRLNSDSISAKISGSLNQVPTSARVRYGRMNGTTRGAARGSDRAAAASARVPSLGRLVASIVATPLARSRRNTSATGYTSVASSL